MKKVLKPRGQTSDHEVTGSNLPRGGIHLMTVWRFMARSLSLSPFHYLDRLTGKQCSKSHNFFFFFFFFFLDLGFTALSRIFHLYRADRSSKVGENRSTRRKTT